MLKKMKSGLLGLYISIVSLMVVSVFFFTDYYGSFHFIRLIIFSLIVSIPVIYGHASIAPYRCQVLGGIFIFALGVHVNTVYFQSNDVRMVVSCIALALFSRAFLFFRGYTLKTPQLIFVGLICVSTVIALFSKMGLERFIIIPYMLILIFMSWQGINLYFIKKTTGFLAIFIASLIALFYHILGGFNFYFFKNVDISLMIQLLHWCMLIVLAHSTTLSRKQYERLHRRNTMRHQERSK